MADRDEPPVARQGSPDDRPRPDPRDRASAAGVVYGVLALSTVIAAESTRRETFPKLVLASGVTLMLYWLGHAYADLWGSRLHGEDKGFLAQMLDSLRQEAAILAGAALPLLVLLVAWWDGAALETAVTAVLWAAAAELVALEAVVALRRHSGLLDLVIQTLVGLSLGVGILVLRVVLH